MCTRWAMITQGMDCCRQGIGKLLPQYDNVSAAVVLGDGGKMYWDRSAIELLETKVENTKYICIETYFLTDPSICSLVFQNLYCMCLHCILFSTVIYKGWTK